MTRQSKRPLMYSPTASIFLTPAMTPIRAETACYMIAITGFCIIKSHVKAHFRATYHPARWFESHLLRHPKRLNFKEI